MAPPEDQQNTVNPAHFLTHRPIGSPWDTPEAAVTATRVAWALAVLLLAAGCGTDGRPVAPPTTPAPATPPPPESPDAPTGIQVVERGNDFIVWEWTPVAGATSYEADISPLEALPEERPPPTVAMAPTARADELEPGTVMEIRVRAVSETAGGRAEGPWSDPVTAGTLAEGCTLEHQRARPYAEAATQDWDGTPLVFHMFDHFPAVSGVADYPASQLEVVRRLAEQIEEHVGYPIIQAGAVIPAPEDAPEGWNDPTMYSPPGCRDWREPGQVVGMHLSSLPTWHRGGGALSAATTCAVVSYWVGDGLPTDDFWITYTRTIIVHELFHVLGFKHSHGDGLPESVGVTMSEQLTFGTASGEVLPTAGDLDALRCIFPEGG